MQRKNLAGRVSPITQELLKSSLKYSQDTGEFVWISKGTLAGTAHSAGYRTIKILSSRYYAHRLAWLYVHGEMPILQIDHVNGDRSDNRIANLRLSTSGQNAQNKCSRPGSTSKYLGVYLHSGSGKWNAQIRVSGKKKNLGYFKSEEEAAAAYCAAKSKLHEFNPKTR